MGMIVLKDLLNVFIQKTLLRIIDVIWLKEKENILIINECIYIVKEILHQTKTSGKQVVTPSIFLKIA